ncbi:MAG: aminotransferase class III-fold pyridoxal phosphate-dependent enzyme [Woeseia sp.]
MRGSGLFIGIEMIKAGTDKEPDAGLTMTLSDRLKDKGFLVSHSGKFHNVLKIRPPLVFTQENADAFLQAFDECMDEVSA